MKTSNRRKLSAVLTALYALYAWSPSALAQEDSVFELSPFEVNASEDEGYLANNSAFGTRLRTSIKDLPLSVESLTREFIDDIGATDMKEALEFTAGIETTDTNLGGFAGSTANFDFSPSRVSSGRNDSTVVTIRGFTSGTMLRRNMKTGIQYDITVIGNNTDVAGTARVEVARGPQALLYGVSFLGGVVNYVPKEPFHQPRYSLKTSFGSDDFLRFEADATGPIGDLLGGEVSYRVVYAYDKKDDWRFQFRDSESDFLMGQLQWRTQKTKLLFEWLFSDWQQTNPNSFTDVRMPGRALEVDEFGNEWLIGEELNNLGDSFNWSGRDPFQDQTANTFVGVLTHQFTDSLYLNVTAQYSTADIDRLYASRGQWRYRNGARNAPDAFKINYTNLFNGNNEDAAYRFQWNDDPFDADQLQVRVDLSYKFEALGGNHDLIAGWLYEKQEFDRFSKHNNRGSWLNVNDVSPISFADYDDGFIEYRGHTEDTRWQDNYYLVYNGRWFKDRLTVIGGLNYNRFRVRNVQYLPVYEDAQGNRLSTGSSRTEAEFMGWEINEALRNEGPGTNRPNRAPVRDFYRFGGDTPSEVTPTIGANYKITDDISIYAVAAGGLFPNPGQRDGRSQNFDAEETQSYEFGLKFDSKDSKISGEVAIYNIERKNAIWFYSRAPAPRENYDPFSGNGSNNFYPDQDRTYAVRKDIVDSIGYMPFVDDGSGGNVNVDGANGTYYLVNYDSGSPQDIQALQAAFNEQRNYISGQGVAAPLDYNENFNLTAGGRLETNNPSERSGSDVAFTEESMGGELLLNYRPTRNLTLLFRASIQEKEVKEGFKLVDHIDPFRENQVNLGTEFDAWVLANGPEAFADPAVPSSFDGSVIEGLSLSTEPEWKLSFYSRYAFTDGPLAGFNIRPGIIITGTRPTTADVGGGNAAANIYKSPDLPTYYDVRLGMGYRTELDNGSILRLSLSINNLLDDDRVEEVTAYDASGTTIRRNVINYYRPRTFRFSASIEF